MTLPEGYRLSHDPADQQIDVIHGYLHTCYWSPGVPRDLVQKAVMNSLCVGVFDPTGAQAGFARLVTDHVSFGYDPAVPVLSQTTSQALRRVSVPSRPYRPLQQSPVSVEGSSCLQLSGTEERHREKSSRSE